MDNIILCNGRGQLGSAFKKLDLSFDRKLYIYHTWNFLDKGFSIQKDCYSKFINFVNRHEEDEIVFISTYSEKDNYYTYFKQLAEAYLLVNVHLSTVIRLPIIIGTGIIKELKYGIRTPYGNLELINVNTAAEKILKIITRPWLLDCTQGNRIHRITGETISAELATHLLTFK